MTSVLVLFTDPIIYFCIINHFLWTGVRQQLFQDSGILWARNSDETQEDGFSLPVLSGESARELGETWPARSGKHLEAFSRLSSPWTAATQRPRPLVFSLELPCGHLVCLGLPTSWQPQAKTSAPGQTLRDLRFQVGAVWPPTWPWFQAVSLLSYSFD